MANILSSCVKTDPKLVVSLFRMAKAFSARPFCRDKTSLAPFTCKFGFPSSIEAEIICFFCQIRQPFSFFAFYVHPWIFKVALHPNLIKRTLGLGSNGSIICPVQWLISLTIMPVINVKFMQFFKKMAATLIFFLLQWDQNFILGSFCLIEPDSDSSIQYMSAILYF